MRAFKNWPLRIKMAMLLVAASVVPLAIAAYIDIRQTEERMLAHTGALLAARGDQLRDAFDTFHQVYLHSVVKLARLPAMVEYLQSARDGEDRLKPALNAILAVHPASDANLRGAAVLDLSGRVKLATESALIGTSVANRSFFRDALRGAGGVSDVYLAGSEVGSTPTIAYLAPVHGAGGKTIGFAVLWVRAASLWEIAKTVNELAGPRSFAVVFDRLGIRIAHTYSDDIVFHPGGKLDPASVAALVAEGRFGERTRALLDDVRSFPEQFERSLAPAPGQQLFHGFAPVNQTWNFGVARRMQTAQWTIFYMIPEESLNALIAKTTRDKAVFAGVIILAALLAGTLFAAVIVKPVGALSTATEAIAGGDLAARVAVDRADELGRLGTSFNGMAERIQTQAAGLQRARDDLELRVQERTAALAQTTRDLEAEVTERKAAQQKLQSQLERLNLLHQITRAIGERQDLRSIFQVVVRTIEEQLPLDFGCVCLHDSAANLLVVTSVGLRSGALALDLAMSEQALVAIDENGLSRCVRGELVYEPDIGEVRFPFPQRLAKGGLRSLVVAPLLVESHVFGVLVAARRQPNSFSSGECEFLRQLSEHVALASHQSQLHGALQQAYDDLRQTQQAVMQQERLRALGQMASGIAHDINNAISPVALYTESLLEREPNLSERARGYLETIKRSVDDVAHTVARMREFYRQREPQLTLSKVQVNSMVAQVVDLTRARWNDMPQQRGVVIAMKTELAPGLPAIMGSESEIREALINLIFNAVDAMPEGGTFTVRTKIKEAAPDAGGEPGPQSVQLEVADTGAGMDEDTRSRCLEPFFTTKGERGTGLGLAMVFGVVQRHSAEIEIESAPGKGTTVRMTFPASAGVETGPAQTHVAAAAPSRLRLLVVDDDPLLLKSLRDTLEADGHQVLAASGGQAGIEAFGAAQGRGETFAAVITDLGMPHVDGRKVAESIKRASPSTPVIMLTGWGQRLVANGDVPSHVDRVLNKPPKLHELRQALAQCCRSAQS
jgi:signal transduction histidine kinase/ActR/RegA family two-component response regulator